MIETMPVKVNTGWIKEYEEDPHGMKYDHYAILAFRHPEVKKLTLYNLNQLKNLITQIFLKIKF
jgi:hypothetical protein